MSHKLSARGPGGTRDAEEAPPAEERAGVTPLGQVSKGTPIRPPVYFYPGYLKGVKGGSV